MDSYATVPVLRRRKQACKEEVADSASNPFEERGNYPMWLDMGPMMSNEDSMALRAEHYGISYPLAVIRGMVATEALHNQIYSINPPE